MKIVRYFTKLDENQEVPFSSIVSQWQIPTASITFRKDSLSLPEWFLDIKNWDWAIQIIMASKGKVFFLNEPFSVYRKHIGGNSYNPEFNEEKTLERLILLVHKFALLLPTYSPLFDKTIKSYSKQLQNIRLRKCFPVIYFILFPRKIVKKVLGALSQM